MHRFGWKWSYYPQWNAILLWGAAPSYGMHGPRTCDIWGYFVSNCWHDFTTGQILILTESRFIVFNLLYRMTSLWVTHFACRGKIILHYVTWKDANFLEMFSISFSILINSWLLKVVIHFSSVRYFQLVCLASAWLCIANWMSTVLYIWNETGICGVSRNEKIQLWQNGTALHIESTFGFQWKKMVKMSLMEVQKFGMSHLKLLFEFNEVSFSKWSSLDIKFAKCVVLWF